MPEVVHNCIALFADDAKLFSGINDDVDHELLQEDLQALQNWAETWQLKFNAKKCKVLHLGRQNPHHKYRMDDVELQPTTEEKDLGVVIDDQLKNDIHTERQVAKANRQLGLIRRSFDNIEGETFILLYKTLVRPHPE